MKILVACEESQVVMSAFRAKGHEAYSCDLERTSGPYPQYHIQGDVIPLLLQSWDMILAFPPCTHLAVSGSRHFAAKRADGRQRMAVEFFLEFTKVNCPRVCIENPVSIMSTLYRKPDQIIQPWQFGHPESKATCLWLKGLPPLIPTKVLEKPTGGRWENQTPSGQNKLGPSPERAKVRSKTYQGIAEAMANQWQI